MKLITIGGLKTFLDELDKRFQPKDSTGANLKILNEIARRVPSYRYEVKLVQTPNQTIIATANKKEYFETFLIEQGTEIGFKIKADTGYIGGDLSLKSVKVKNDIEVTATEAVLSPELEEGNKIFFDTKGKIYESFKIPPFVNVVKIEIGKKVKYVKVSPQKIYIFSAYVIELPVIEPPEDSMNHKKIYNKKIFGVEIEDENNKSYEIKYFDDTKASEICVFWSKKINEHEYDFDLTIRNDI